MVDLILDIIEILHKRKHDNAILINLLKALLDSTIINNDNFENMLPEIYLTISALLDDKPDDYIATINDITEKIKEKYELFMKQFENKLVELFNKVKLLTEANNQSTIGGNPIDFDGNFSNLERVLQELESSLHTRKSSNRGTSSNTQDKQNKSVQANIPSIHPELKTQKYPEFIRVNDPHAFEKMEVMLLTEQETISEIRTQHANIVKILEDELKKYTDQTDLIYNLKSEKETRDHVIANMMLGNAALKEEIKNLRDENIKKARSYEIPKHQIKSSNIENISLSLETLGKIILQGDDDNMEIFIKLYKDKPTNWISSALDLLLDNVYNTFIMKGGGISELIIQKNVLERNLLEEFGKNVSNYKRYSEEVDGLKNEIKTVEKIKDFQKQNMESIIRGQSTEINILKEENEQTRSNHEKTRNEVSEIIRQKKNVESDILFEKEVSEFNKKRYDQLNEVYIDLLNEYKKIKDTLKKKQTEAVQVNTQQSTDTGLNNEQSVRILQLENLIVEQNKLIYGDVTIINEDKGNQEEFDRLNNTINGLLKQISEYTSSEYDSEKEINKIREKYQKNLQTFKDEQNELYQNKIDQITNDHETRLMKLTNLIKLFTKEKQNLTKANLITINSLSDSNSLINELEKGIGDLEKRIGDSDSELKKEKKRYETLSQEKDICEITISERDNTIQLQIKNIERANDNFQKRIQKLTNEKKGLHDRLSGLEKSNKDLHSRNTELQIKEKRLESNIVLLKDDLKNKKRELSQESKTLSISVSDHSKTKKELDNTRTKLFEKENEIVDISEKLGLKKQQLNLTKQELDKTRNELGSTRKELGSTRNELDKTRKDLEHKLLKKEYKIAGISTELDKTKQQLDNKKAELDTSEHELKRSVKKLSEKENELSEKENELLEKENELSKKEKELETKEKELETKEKELETKEKELETKQSELQQTQDKLKTKERELQQTQGKLQQTQDKLETKESELKQTQGELGAVKSEIESIRNELSKNESENNEKNNTTIKTLTKVLKQINEQLFNNEMKLDDIEDIHIKEWYTNEHEKKIHELNLINEDLLNQIGRLKDDKLINIFDTKFGTKPFLKKHLDDFKNILLTNVKGVLQYYNLNDGVKLESEQETSKTNVELFYDIIFSVFNELQKKCIAKIIITDNNEYLINQKFENINTPFAIMLKVSKKYKERFNVSTILDKPNFILTHKRIFNIISKDDLDFMVNYNDDSVDDMVISMYINTLPPDNIDQTYTTLKLQNNTDRKYNLYNYNKSNSQFKVLRNDITLTNELYKSQIKTQGGYVQKGGNMISNNFGIYIWKICLPMYIIKLLRYRYLIKNKHNNNRHLNDFCINLICCVFLYSIQDINLLYPYIIDLICTSFAYQICSNENIIVYPFFLSYMFVNYE
jgi:uncharacterized protein (DUF3084 family)